MATVTFPSTSSSTLPPNLDVRFIIDYVLGGGGSWEGPGSKVCQLFIEKETISAPFISCHKSYMDVNTVGKGKIKNVPPLFSHSVLTDIDASVGSGFRYH